MLCSFKAFHSSSKVGMCSSRQSYARRVIPSSFSICARSTGPRSFASKGTMHQATRLSVEKIDFLVSHPMKTKNRVSPRVMNNRFGIRFLIIARYNMLACYQLEFPNSLFPAPPLVHRIEALPTAFVRVEYPDTFSQIVRYSDIP